MLFTVYPLIKQKSGLLRYSMILNTCTCYSRILRNGRWIQNTALSTAETFGFSLKVLKQSVTKIWEQTIGISFLAYWANWSRISYSSTAYKVKTKDSKNVFIQEQSSELRREWFQLLQNNLMVPSTSDLRKMGKYFASQARQNSSLIRHYYKVKAQCRIYKVW